MKAGAFVLAALGLVCIACAPTSEEVPSSEPVAASEQPDLQALLEQGQEIYAASCAGCHGPDGEGGFGPAHAGNANLADTEFVVGRILNGQGEMPVWGTRLSDEEIAAVATYLRNTWGNDFGAVSPAEVAAQR